ncbi:hypothetical protein TL5118_00083 [Thalassovita autumnalis]|uniref:Uncharacterized protein n=1 Tax=Thalassovita autumnalis TaxID=2072972 RepID=A0A0P1FPI5_9RHOB|nr:hypothetical protein [Thalassovita autumnalis]CUH62583.1 hypothetical protein TL5118_00083 [Thalassovita autumnalis]CUH70341.1 hypothetical protein TL5120_00114 [Thalassovita autumnalis]
MLECQNNLSVQVAAFAALCLCSTPAHACPDGATSLVSCPLKGGTKVLQTCLLGDHATYAFGKVGQTPDLHLARPVTDIAMTPWPGIGRYIWEDFTFSNGATSYRVFYGIDKMAEGAGKLTGGVAVEQGGKVLAELYCDLGKVTTSGYPLPLYEAKEAAGQVYSLEAQAWSD